MIRPASALTILMTIATCIASCSSKQERPTPPGMDLASMQMKPAAPGSCRIDAIKMCQAVGGTAAPQTEQKATIPMPSYGPPSLPDSIEFQIPAGQNIKLMCYYDPQHTSVYRADATPDAALTENSVEYMKKQGFCANK
ncbi:MAG: hypothetical protein WAU82_12810 [Candidatus Binatus sp.]|uniref:hypothetical protein n=1 Tax=Candidatus Binatus sp. TaxID=2811406 RepID=UPI003BB1AEEF